MDTINIAGLDKAAVLAALYNRARPQGMGFLHYTPADMTVEQARELLDAHPDQKWLDFDYLKGRVMKVSLGGDDLRIGLYDRDNGEGAAERALAPLRQSEAA